MNSQLMILASILVSSHALVWGGEDMAYVGSPPNHPSNKFYQFLVKFKEVMKHGNGTLGLPILDPYMSKQEELILDEKLFSLHSAMQNLSVVGMSNYEVNSAAFAMLGMKATLNLTWPAVSGTTNYVVNGTAISTFPIFGKGAVEVAIKGLNFASTIKLSVKEKTVYIKDMTTHIHMDSISFNATGIFYNNDLSQIISSVISDVTPQIMEDYQLEVSKVVNKVVMKILNAKLSKMTMQQIIGLIS